MAKKISGSVGKGGKNKEPDVLLVQQLLNPFASKCGFKKLDEDGLIGPKTNAAIAAVQKKAVGMSRADSRVDPSGETFAALAMGPKKAEAEAKKADKAEKAEKEAKASGGKGAENGEGKSGGGQAGKPQVKGAVQGLDKRLKGVLDEVSAFYNKVIHVELGKQKSVASKDVKSMWKDWNGKLKRGTQEAALRGKEKLREQLDDHYSHTDFEGFAKLVEARVFKKQGSGGADDAHATGRAVDIKGNTDQKVIDALATVLQMKKEGSVVHFDDGGKSLPKAIPESTKKKWKKA